MTLADDTENSRDGLPTVLACPACDGSRIYRRGGNTRSTAPDSQTYLCEDCGEVFDKGVTRPSRGSEASHSPSGLAGVLDDLDPDAVSGGDGR